MTNLRTLCLEFLEPLRSRTADDIEIIAGYRVKHLDEQHYKCEYPARHHTGKAVDFRIKHWSNWQLIELLRNEFEYDELVPEFMVPGDDKAGWIHITYEKDQNRKRYYWQGVKQQ